MAEEQQNPNFVNLNEIEAQHGLSKNNSYRNIMDYNVLPQRHWDLSHLEKNGANQFNLDQSPIREIIKNMQTAFARSKSTQQMTTVNSAKIQENRETTK